MCFEFKFLPFYHPYFSQSLIPLKFYVQKAIFIVSLILLSPQMAISTSSSSLTSYDANIALNNVLKKCNVCSSNKGGLNVLNLYC